MSALGWNTILEGWPWFTGAGQYPISAYSEFMPPPLLGRGPYGSADLLLQKEDPWGWPVTEYEEGQCHGNSDSSAVRRRLASSDETDIV